MDYLWSPWRMEYIENHIHEEGCVFCKAVQRADGPENLVVYRGERAFVMLNRYPYTTGHLMVVPYEHQSDLTALTAATRGEIMELTATGVQVLRSVYHPQAFNIGMNLGTAAGAGIAAHLHMHIVPRWSGDTNFMSTLAHTRVLPEALEDSYKRIRMAWNNLS